MIVISDTTPVISLLKANRLELLHQLYHRVIIPKAVYDELVSNTSFADEAKIVQNCTFLLVQNVSNLEAVNILRNVTGLDAGESEALIIYGEQNADLLLMDENKGRKVARQLDVKHIGTIGILLDAYNKGLLIAEEVKDCLDAMLKCNIRISKSLCNMVLEYIGFPVA